MHRSLGLTNKVGVIVRRVELKGGHFLQSGWLLGVVVGRRQWVWLRAGSPALCLFVCVTNSQIPTRRNIIRNHVPKCGL